MANATFSRREFVAAALGAVAVAGLGGCAGPSGVSGAGGAAGSGDGAGAGGSAGGTAGSAGGSSAGDLGLVSAGTLTLAARADDLPYFQDANSSQSGFAYELLNTVAERMGLSCTWSKVSSTDSLLARVSADGELVRGQRVHADASVLTCAPALDASMVQVDYLSVTQCLVAKKSSDITGVESLAGKTVGVLAGSPAVATVSALSLNPAPTVKEYSTQTELFSGLQARNVDAVVADTCAANYHLRVAYGDEQKVCEIGSDQAMYGLVLPASQTALRDGLADVLQQLRDDGTYQQLYDSWFAEADNSRGKTDARTPEQGAPGHDKGGGV